MGKLLKRPVDQVREHARQKVEPQEFILKGDFKDVVSTGSTWLDLAISGGKIRGGGIPGGIIVEIFGPSSSGKTAILSEIVGHTQAQGGNVRVADPEARMDKEYSRFYGVNLDAADYHMPDTVNQLFDETILNWKPPDPPPGIMNVIATDSIAALSSELELGSVEGDKMGMRIGKDFAKGFRRTARLIRKNNWLIANTNQVRQGQKGEVTPGGLALEFFASLRIRVGPPASGKYIKRKEKFEGKDHEQTMGIRSFCTVKKSTVDNPYRTAEVFIMFNYGLDDIRGNLHFLKKTLNLSSFLAVDKNFVAVIDAVHYIEDKGLRGDLKEMVINTWEKFHSLFIEKRQPKYRGK